MRINEIIFVASLATGFPETERDEPETDGISEVS